jgi:uncharacterized repeat protein (TIGR01451 family)
MKKLFSRLPKKLLGVALVVVAVSGLTAGVKAWYPNRPTFTMQNPAPYVTFNSITDNPDYGDERTFFDGKDAANTASGGFAGKVNVKDGEEVLLRVYVHNDASSNLNGADFTGEGVAHGAKVRIALPTATAGALRANAYINATNAKPGEVADSLDFGGATPFSVSYVPGSAVMYTNAVPTGFKLSDSIVTSGAAIGYKGANGTIPGCLEYSGIVTIKVKVNVPTFKMEKRVALPGDKAWGDSVNAKAGQTVKYEISFTNTGKTTLNDVVVRDQLPKDVKIVPGSTKIYNANYSNGVSAGTDAVVSNGGISIGSYTAGSNAYVDFEATMPSADKLVCGINKLTNIAEVSTNGQALTDTADVVVNKECQPEQPQPQYSCTAFEVTKGENRTVTVSKFTTSQKNATFKSVVIDWGENGVQPLSTNKAVGQTHQYAAEGTYTVTATAHFSTAKDNDVTSTNNCVATVTFSSTTPPETPKVLPSTGAGSVIGLFAVTAAAASAAYYFVVSRRFARQ